MKKTTQNQLFVFTAQLLMPEHVKLAVRRTWYMKLPLLATGACSSMKALEMLGFCITNSQWYLYSEILVFRYLPSCQVG